MASKDEIVKAIIRSLDAMDSSWTLKENQGGAGQHCLAYTPLLGVKPCEFWFCFYNGDVRVNVERCAPIWNASQVRDLNFAVGRFLANRDSALSKAHLLDMEKTFYLWLN